MPSDISRLTILQAVTKLKDDIAGMDEEECGDAIVLPLYAALPPDQQVGSPPAETLTYGHRKAVLPSSPLLTYPILRV